MISYLIRFCSKFDAFDPPGLISVVSIFFYLKVSSSVISLFTVFLVFSSQVFNFAEGKLLPLGNYSVEKRLFACYSLLFEFSWLVKPTSKFLYGNIRGHD